MRRLLRAIVIAVFLVAAVGTVTSLVVVGGVCQSIDPSDWFLWWWYGCSKDDAAGGGGSGAGH